MKKYFIDHPVFALVISIVIVLMGCLALNSLSMEQFPDIAPPTVNVSATYPGASAETVKKSVIVPLEESINGVEGMTYMTSSADNNGTATINVYFAKGTDADMATVNVYNRIQSAQADLPAEVTKQGVTATKQQNAELMTIALYSPNDTYDRYFIDNYAKINIEPRLKRIAGVGSAMVMGANYSMRLWLDPDKMAQYKLTPPDNTSALANQNIEAATGAFGAEGDNTNQFTMKYRGRLSTPEEFGNLVVRALDGGQVLRLREVANIEMGSQSYQYYCNVNGHAGSAIMLNQKAGSNASAAINAVKAELEDISKTLPNGLEIIVLNDSNRFLDASVNTVKTTLFEAILLVIVIMFVFLQDLRSTIIPSVSIIVSIVGTFSALYVAGFSLNMLTLFALVLAIGTVVDDAIIVVEAVQARFDAGYRSPYLATTDAMRNVAGAIVTSTFIFMAVFIPTAFMGGTSGEFYKQFGITMAVAVGISAINAFTLTPALCAIIMRPAHEDGDKPNFAARFRKAFNAVFGVLCTKYLSAVRLLMRRRWLAWSTLAVGMVLLAVLVRNVQTGLVPTEDTGYAFLSINTKPGTSQAENTRVMQKVQSLIDSIPEIENKAALGGFSFMGSGPSMGMFFLPLKEWSERKGQGQSASEVVAKLYAIAPQVPEATIMADVPPLITGYGNSSGVELYLQDRAEGDINDFKAVADSVVDALNARPEISMAYTSFETSYPQYWVDIDPARCALAGTTPSEVLDALSGYFGGNYVSNFNRFSKLYEVQLQLAPEDRMDESALQHTYIRVNERMAPLSEFVRLTHVMGSQELTRFNLYNSIYISATAAQGYSSGAALNAVEEVMAQTLPQNYSYEYGGISREQAGAKNNTIVIFALCLVLVYLILCALYESFILPFSVVLVVPLGLMGSFAMAKLFGLENNIYMQTGLIMLIGLLAKTSILITEYALTHRKEGHSLVMSAFSAARERLRPILMTVLSMVFGMLPLATSMSVGANGNRTLGITVIGGMVVGTLALLVLVPVMFVFFRYLHEKMATMKRS